jgi:hypothetical protein
MSTSYNEKNAATYFVDQKKKKHFVDIVGKEKNFARRY